jgi:antitoxin HigA-1
MKYSGDVPIPVHPGEILTDFIHEYGLTQVALGRHIGVDPSKINEICRGRRGISPVMAVKFAKAFKTSVELWMNLQQNWELSQVDQSAIDVEPLKRLA